MPDGLGDRRVVPRRSLDRLHEPHPRRAVRGEGRVAGRRRARSSDSSAASTARTGSSTVRSTCTSSPPTARSRPRNLTPGEFEYDGIELARRLVRRRHVRPRTRHVGHRHDDRPLRRRARRRRSGPHAMTAHDGDYGHPSVSPDGTTVAFIGAPAIRRLPAERARSACSRATPGRRRTTEITWISTGFDRTFDATAGFRSPVWETDEAVLAIAEDRGDTHLIPLDGRRIAPTRSGDERPVQRARASMPPEERSPRRAPRSTTRASCTSATTCAPRSAMRWPPDCSAGSGSPCRPPTGPTRSTAGSCDRPTSTTTPRYPVLLNVHGGPHTQYGETSSTRPRCRPPPASSCVMGNPRGGSGRHEGVGPGDHGPEAPRSPGHRMGFGRRRRRAVDARRRARPLRVLRSRSRRHARRSLRRVHGHVAGGLPERPVPGLLLASGP